MAWNIELPTAEFYTLQSPELDGLVREAADTPELAIDTETTGLVSWKERPLFWSLSWGSRRICMPADTLPAFRKAFADRYKRWIFANAKFDCHMLANVGIEVCGRLVDTQVMHALLYEEQPHTLEHMGKTVLGMAWKGLIDDWKTSKGRTKMAVGDYILHVFDTTPHHLIEYASNDAYVTFKIYEKLKAELEAAQTYTLYPGLFGTLWDLFNRTEVPFTKVLWHCERNGLKIDVDYLKSRQGPAQKELESTERAINQLAGTMLNPKSPAQLQDYFFTKLGLRPTKFTKGGKSGRVTASVDASFLESYADTVPMAKLLLRHRDLEKVLGTYIKGVLERLDPRGYLHTRFNQDVARTGRLSCIASWTPLKTTRGIVPVSEVGVGDHVWTHQGRWRRVLRAFTKGWEDMYDVHLSNGEVLTCTADHKLLRTDGRWFKLKELLDEHQQRVGQQQGELGEGARALPFLRASDDGGDRQNPGHNTTQRGLEHPQLHAGSGERSAGSRALLQVEDGAQEPDEGPLQRSAPALERGVPGWGRVPDLPVQRHEAIRSSSGAGQSTGIGKAPGGIGGASHRWGSSEQRPGQSGADDPRRAQDHSLFAGEGLPGIGIEAVHHRGRCEVHDLTVEEDASYLACGVFSHNSSDPNMQNWPKPENDEFFLRGAVICEPDEEMLVGDYEALEMRLLAAGAQEAKMIQIFLDGWDIHMGNASLMYGIPYDDLIAAKKIDKEVKKELDEIATSNLAPLDRDAALAKAHAKMTPYVLKCLTARGDAKTIGFGLNYGMKAGKLAGRLGCTKPEAQAKIDTYMATYPAVTRFYDESIEKARRTGYSFTLLGRRRFLPEIVSQSEMERWGAERQAVNTIIQGTAADAVKMAMVNIFESGLLEEFGAKMRSQIHDELIHTCPRSMVGDLEGNKKAMSAIKEMMEHPFPTDLEVPLSVSIGHGVNWLNAK